MAHWRRLLERDLQNLFASIRDREFVIGLSEALIAEEATQVLSRVAPSLFGWRLGCDASRIRLDRTVGLFAIAPDGSEMSINDIPYDGPSEPGWMDRVEGLNWKGCGK